MVADLTQALQIFGVSVSVFSLAAGEKTTGLIEKET